jgi:p-aminobenzoyl-glutamate transporter AbgT
VSSTAEKKSMTARFLSFVERTGNALPHPASLFLIAAVLVLVLSAVVAAFDVAVVHPGTGESVAVLSLLSVEGFTGFFAVSSRTSPVSRRSEQCWSQCSASLWPKGVG